MVNTDSRADNSASAIIGRVDNHESIAGGEKRRTRVMSLDVVLRVLGMILTLISAILVGVDTQTKVVQVQLKPNLPLFDLHLHAKSHYSSAIVYFVVANSIAHAYAVVSLFLLLASRKSGKKGLGLAIVTLDLVTVALLFSGVAAASTIGVIAYKGNSHLQWNKICNMFERFCAQLGIGIILSFIASIIFLLLVLVSFFKIHMKKN